MIGLGTIANVAAIMIGSFIGLLLKGGLKQRFQDTIMNALGLAVMFIGLSGALQGIFYIKGEQLDTKNIMLMIVSLAVGAFLGEVINIEARLDRMGEMIKKTLKVKVRTL